MSAKFPHKNMRKFCTHFFSQNLHMYIRAKNPYVCVHQILRIFLCGNFALVIFRKICTYFCAKIVRPFFSHFLRIFSCEIFVLLFFCFIFAYIFARKILMFECTKTCARKLRKNCAYFAQLY